MAVKLMDSLPQTINLIEKERMHMLNSSLLKEELMIMDMDISNKAEAIYKLVSLLYDKKIINSREAFIEVVNKREEEFSTGIGFGIAFPHGKSNIVKMPAIVFGKNKKPIEYGSIDKQPVTIFFLIAVPENANEQHLRIISSLARKLMNEEIREGLDQVKTSKEVLDILQ
jgi:PTS system nitrogen regulatory IIA component